ncbi:MAG: NifB/NifX family molybdenum-iron cluster-binding protein [Chloroflexota bacterium]|nr:NifB/NifX family molybdenum-iron cluster-binding protein [Chloroflexota bacterium]
MKIAISSTSPDLEADVDPRFGRCQYFVLVDPDTMESEGVENINMMAGGGAGIATAQMVADKGAQAVLTGNCGPNAHQTLSAAGIEVITGVSGTVREAIEDYRSGGYEATSQPNVEAHHGSRGIGNGRGTGKGSSRGKGFRQSGETEPQASFDKAAAQTTQTDRELESLKSQTKELSSQLGRIQQRIDNVSSDKGH